MKMMFKRALAPLMAAGLMMTAGVALAAEIGSHSFKIAVVQVKEHPFSMGAQKFADIVAEKSGGKMKSKIFPGGTLGGDAQVISSLQGGTIDMTVVSTGLLSTMIKEYGVFYLPLMFDDVRVADAVVDGPVGTKLLEKLPEKGLVGLGYWEHGYRDTTNSKHPITKWEDMQGLKIRVIQIPIFVDIFNGVGANAVPMPFTELYTALEQKAVDGQETALPTIETAKFDEVQKYLTTTHHVYDPLVVLFSKKTWDKLSADERQILTDAAKEATPYQRELNRQREVEMLKAVQAKGMVVTDMSKEERARMRQHLQPVTDKYTQEVGADLVKEIFAEIDKARSQLAAK
ncbi:ABC transporter substrate-binding protein [Skermanella aerolata]|uniref:ABC transporter substrate-binding protein n=1 Tax=Skermanella aerolata TaxID=393310 RepID=A0A512E111_9PROT|nr:TRAP transporter substrate-binding protein [Skermanella aerolata]GEO42379.1 ABC transporter substrate-binding protein [Skermanella aerolata]